MPDLDAATMKPHDQLRDFALMLALAVVLLLVTDNVAVAAALPSINAGRNSFRCGLWVLSTDQRHARARVCAAFLFATSCWKAAAAALVSVIVFVTMFHLNGNPPNMDRFAVTMTVLAAGLSLTTIAGLAATLAAAMTDIRVWVHPRLRELVQGELKNAVHLAPGLYFNHAVFVVATSIGLPATSLSALLITTPRSGAVTATAIIGGAMTAIICYWWLSSRMIAQDPAECWSSSSQPHVESDQYITEKL
jgi:hypothetical protein